MIEQAPVICDWDELAGVCEKVRTAGKRLAFTNGCFDLIHAGHIWLLEQARRSADVLVVGLNTDAGIAVFKGTGRPLLREEGRGRIMAGIRWVDYVTFFGQPTPLELIERLRPDVLVKGSDYGHEEIVGAREVESWGGSVLSVKRLEQYSSTSIIERVRESRCDTG